MPGGFPSLASNRPQIQMENVQGKGHQSSRVSFLPASFIAASPEPASPACSSMCLSRVEFLNSSAPGVTHPSRLNRDLQNRFGSSAYAMEESRAELASAFVANERKRVVFPSGSLVRGAVAGSRLHHRIFDEFCDARRQTMRVHKRHPQCKRGPFRQGWRECAKRRRSRFILKVLPALRLIDQLQV